MLADKYKNIPVQNLKVYLRLFKVIYFLTSAHYNCPSNNHHKCLFLLYTYAENNID